MKWAAAIAIGSAAVLAASACNAATSLYIGAVKADSSEATLLEPAAFSQNAAGYWRASLIDITVFGDVDITEFELDCAGRRLKVTSEKLYDSKGELSTDKTQQNSKDWITFPVNSQMEQHRTLICGWPGSRKEGYEVQGPDFWTVVQRMIGLLEVPPGFFD